MAKPFFLFSHNKVQALKCTLCPQLGGLWAWFEVKLNFLLSVTHVVDCALYVHDIFVASIKSILIKRPSGMSGGPIISYWGNLAATNLPFPSSTLKTTQFSFFDIHHCNSINGLWRLLNFVRLILLVITLQNFFQQERGREINICPMSIPSSRFYTYWVFYISISKGLLVLLKTRIFTSTSIYIIKQQKLF